MRRHGAFVVTRSQRNPTPLFGLGLIDAITDAAIEDAAAFEHPLFPEVKGRTAPRFRHASRRLLSSR